jgi:hypothetical protein
MLLVNFFECSSLRLTGIAFKILEYGRVRSGLRSFEVEISGTRAGQRKVC